MSSTPDAAKFLELEIRRQHAITNYGWARRVFRRLNRDPQTELRIILEGVSHSFFRRQFGHWDLVGTPTLEVRKDTTLTDRAQAHRFQQYGKSEKDPYFVNRTLDGTLKPQKKKQKLQPKRKGQSTHYGFNDRTPCEVTVKKEEREVKLQPGCTKLQQWCDFRRFQNKRHGGGASIKVYKAGTIAFVSRIRVTYRHHDHCPSITLRFDSAKLVKSQAGKLIPRFPWDRAEEQ